MFTIQIIESESGQKLYCGDELIASRDLSGFEIHVIPRSNYLLRRLEKFIDKDLCIVDGNLMDKATDTILMKGLDYGNL
jgi:hypothetical protein